MGGRGSGRPTKTGEKPEMDKSKMTPARKRTIVAGYFFKGYNQTEIMEKTGFSRKEVSAAVQSIKENLKPKTIPDLEYYRNKSRKLIGIGLSTAFGILDDNNNKEYPYLRLRALAVIKDYAKLSADIDGITGEKITAGPDSKAAKLMSELKEMATKPKKSTEVEELADADAEQGADRPDSEQDTVSEEQTGGDGIQAIGTASPDNL